MSAGRSLSTNRVRLAFDRSVRSFDSDGHMRIADCIMTRACVSPYWSEEIPGADALGLKPNTVYNLLRPEFELARAVPSLRGKPLLRRHLPISAEDHPHDDVVGTVGTDARFENPVIRGSLVVWSDEGIGAIESGATKDLSAGYQYRAVPERGEYGGVQYTHKMVDIRFNHLALVENGRVEGAYVGDSALKRKVVMARRFGRDEAGAGDLPDEDQTISSENYKSLIGLLSDKLDPEEVEAIRCLIEVPNSDDDTDKTLTAMDSAAVMSAARQAWPHLPTDIKREFGYDSARYVAGAPQRHAKARATMRQNAADEPRMLKMFPNMNRLGHR